MTHPHPKAKALGFFHAQPKPGYFPTVPASKARSTIAGRRIRRRKAAAATVPAEEAREKRPRRPRHRIRKRPGVTPPRPLIPGVLEAWTRRTNFRKAALSPWDPQVQQIYLYSLAKAAHETGVDLHITTQTPNHHHTQGTPRHKNADIFLHRFHQPVSSGLNRLLDERGFDRMGQIWDNQQPSRMRVVGAVATMTALIYDKVQCVAAGLVDHANDWPGWTFRWEHWKPNRRMEILRPAILEPSRHEASYPLNFHTPESLQWLFEDDVNRLVYVMNKVEHAVSRKIVRARKWRARGPEFIRNIHPYDEPRTPPEAPGRSAPSFKLGAAVDEEGRQLRIHCCNEVAAFRGEHLGALREWRNGNRDVCFPYGTNLMERLHGARVAEAPHPDAVLYTPEHPLEDRHITGMSRDVNEAVKQVLAIFDVAAHHMCESSESVFVGRNATVAGRRTRRAKAAKEKRAKKKRKAKKRKEAAGESEDPKPPPRADGPDDGPPKDPAADPNAEPAERPPDDNDEDKPDVTRVGPDERDQDPPPATDDVDVQDLDGRRRTNPNKPPRRIVVRRTRDKGKRPRNKDRGRRASDPPDD